MEVLVSLRGLERLDKDDFADEEKEEAEEIFKARLEEKLEQDQVGSEGRKIKYFIIYDFHLLTCDQL